ncbi:MAG: hypothetical protein ACREUX_13305, partial [Burkholderiales bacterium]
MRSLRLFAVGLAALATLLTSAAAWSDGGRRGHHHRHHHHSHGSRLHLGFVFGGPLWYPGPAFPYSYPYPYAYPSAIVVPPTPRVYIERADRVAQESAPGYWYFCRESNTYYPYVKECAQPWE